jgi:hypothetical protein
MLLGIRRPAASSNYSGSKMRQVDSVLRADLLVEKQVGAEEPYGLTAN